MCRLSSHILVKKNRVLLGMRRYILKNKYVAHLWINIGQIIMHISKLWKKMSVIFG